MSGVFQSGTQYGDWNGTASADEFGAAKNDLDELFQATGEVKKDEEILIAFEFSYIEGHFYVSGYFHRLPAENNAGWLPSLKDKFEQDKGPIKVKQVRLHITLDEFSKRFKRFNVVLAANPLKLDGREYLVEGDDFIS
jgi:hypothetical protein